MQSSQKLNVKITENNAMKQLPIFFLLICIFIITGTVYPGTTGKIAGESTDAATGEPLISVSIFIKKSVALSWLFAEG